MVYLLPAISGYVDSDIAAGALFTGIHLSNKLSLFVDIGTNAEIVLGNKEKMLACSTPAGPAFEGAQIRYGMSALPGAISHVSLRNGTLQLEVIGDAPPQGICGSGLIDLVAELRRVGLINEKGNLLSQSRLSYTERVTIGERGQSQFLVDDGPSPIYLTQQDIRELQLAKGAIRSGVEIALREWGASEEDVEVVYLAGAFGNYLRREGVLRLGMLPPFPQHRFKPVGNAAGQGAKLCLLNNREWSEIHKLVGQVQYLELSYHKGFGDVFMRNMHFPVNIKSAPLPGHSELE